MTPASLTGRLALLTGVWVAAGLLATWIVVAGIVVSHIEEAFDARLSGLLDAVVAGTETEPDGRPVLRRAVSEPGFDEPLSGVYWQTEGPGGVATSRSLWDQTLPPAQANHAGRVVRDVPGPRGQHLRLAEQDVALPESTTPLHVQVAVARDDTDAEIGRLRRVLGIGFGLLGAGLVAGSVIQVSFVLAPLRRLRGAVAELRAGRRRTLDVPAGAEVQPLVAEIDALVAQNRATVERARSHIGNLAHALRTSLAVMRNAVDDPDAVDLDVLRSQLVAAERLVDHHLTRARTAALAGSTAEDVAVASLAEEIAAALRRLFADKAVVIEVTGVIRLRARCDRQDLAEMVGNLMENACKWGRTLVAVTVGEIPGRVVVGVADDGPGLRPEQIQRALDRGARFDEAAPGSGLGLAIAADLAALYGGDLTLGRSKFGGLQAWLSLPAARSV
jgi:signal transduction histidine kinase